MYKAFFIDINFNQTPGKIVIIMICGGGVSAGKIWELRQQPVFTLIKLIWFK